MTKPTKEAFYARDIDAYGKVLRLRGLSDDSRKEAMQVFIDGLPEVPDDAE